MKCVLPPWFPSNPTLQIGQYIIFCIYNPCRYLIFLLCDFIALFAFSLLFVCLFSPVTLYKPLHTGMLKLQYLLALYFPRVGSVLSHSLLSFRSSSSISTFYTVYRLFLTTSRHDFLQRLRINVDFGAESWPGLLEGGGCVQRPVRVGRNPSPAASRHSSEDLNKFIFDQSVYMCAFILCVYVYLCIYRCIDIYMHLLCVCI